MKIDVNKGDRKINRTFGVVTGRIGGRTRLALEVEAVRYLGSLGRRDMVWNQEVKESMSMVKEPFNRNKL